MENMMENMMQHLTVNDNPTDKELRERCMSEITEWYRYYVLEICRKCGAILISDEGRWETASIVEICVECFNS